MKIAKPDIIQRLEQIGYIVDKYESRTDGAYIVWLANRPTERNNGAYYRKLKHAGLYLSQYGHWGNETLIHDVIHDYSAFWALGKPSRIVSQR